MSEKKEGKKSPPNLTPLSGGFRRVKEIMKKQGIYAYAVVSTQTGTDWYPVSNSQPRLQSPEATADGGQVKMENIFLVNGSTLLTINPELVEWVNYKDLTLIGEMVNISDFQKELQEALKNPKTMETVLIKHQGFLDRLMRGTTVVPFQFGTILKNKKGAIDHLKSSYARYKELLKKFKNREEWGIRVFATQYHPKSRKKLGTGTAYLLRKKQEEKAEKATNERLTFFSEEIFNSLKELAFDYKVTKSSQRFSEKGEVLISVFAFLLGKSKVKEFNQKLTELEKKYQEFGLRLTISGPWPAYNFVK